MDDFQNITSISKADLALIVRDQFQSFGIEGMNYSICFSAKSDYFAETKALAEPAVRFYTKLYLQPFTLEETLEYADSALHLSPHASAAVAGWLHEKTLGHPYFLAFVCKHLSATVSRIEPRALEPTWPAIFDQLGREKFALDVSQLSTKELDLIHQFAIMGQSELAPHDFRGKALPPAVPRVPETNKMNPSNCKHGSHQRAELRRQACRRNSAVPFPFR